MHLCRGCHHRKSSHRSEVLYLSLRIFQHNFHIFTSAPGILVLPDEVSGRARSYSSICSPDLTTEVTQEHFLPVLPRFQITDSVNVFNLSECESLPVK